MKAFALGAAACLGMAGQAEAAIVTMKIDGIIASYNRTVETIVGDTTNSETLPINGYSGRNFSILIYYDRSSDVEEYTFEEAFEYGEVSAINGFLNWEFLIGNEVFISREMIPDNYNTIQEIVADSLYNGYYSRNESGVLYSLYNGKVSGEFFFTTSMRYNESRWPTDLLSNATLYSSAPGWGDLLMQEMHYLFEGEARIGAVNYISHMKIIPEKVTIIAPAPVPLPAAAPLLLAGTAALWAISRRRQRVTDR
ncbi:hypothetical protein [Haematobacter genomosp. 1]|uniref:hypothetical protein n=1 Tax=Haematobacter genomosp. 1 TaxID=366618 RepID=UPI00117BB777|nr:hypothetical protein [Haematobacter genomosp. 1]